MVRGSPEQGLGRTSRSVSPARRMYNRDAMPCDPSKRLTIRQILEWADSHFERVGRWPTGKSGRVRGQGGLTWLNIDTSLRFGRFGLAGGQSLHQLLKRKRGKPESKYGTGLPIGLILEWADEHRRRTGRWPNQKSGRIRGAIGETWVNVDSALRYGHRGLRGGSSLPLLLDQYGRKRHALLPPRLTVRQILEWADEHKRRTGRWPSQMSGSVHGQRKLTWYRIHEALYHGQRGLKGGSSLARLLDQYRRRRRST